MGEEINRGEEGLKDKSFKNVKDPRENISPIQPVTEHANSTEPSASNKLETETMEVHHHPHVHHSKKWKDYLFEFLMLFLAVSGGFFVENLREENVEHHRAQVLATSLYKDLQ